MLILILIYSSREKIEGEREIQFTLSFSRNNKKNSN
jgi:hypothetical protein